MPLAQSTAPGNEGTALAAGTLLANRYELLELRGRGGMGEVWAALDRERGQDVAIKVMLSLDGELAERFEREARLLEQLDNPHVPRVFAAASLDDGRRFMALELLEGQSLSKLVNDESLPVGRAVSWLLQAMEGLAAAHAVGIVHRDLKPSNLFVCGSPEDATIKLLDFGISKRPPSMSAEEPTLTVTGTSMGSPGYMSPEQLRDTKRVDRRTDIWALGLCLHRCLAGRPAFEAQDAGEYFAMIMTEPPTPLRKHVPDAPAALERIILRCAERDPGRRFPDVAALADALAPHAEDGPASATRIRETLGAHAAPPGSYEHEEDGSSTATATTKAWGPTAVDARAASPVSSRGGPRLTPVLAVAAVAVGGLAAFVSFSGAPDSPTPQPAHSADVPAATSAPSAATTPTTIEEPAPSPPEQTASARAEPPASKVPSPAAPVAADPPAPVAPTASASPAPRLPKSAVGGPIEVDL